MLSNPHLLRETVYDTRLICVLLKDEFPSHLDDVGEAVWFGQHRIMQVLPIQRRGEVHRALRVRLYSRV